MAALTSTQHQLPTAWLAPPAGLLLSNTNVKIEPAPLAISAILAFFILAVVTLIFNKKRKGNYLDDRDKDFDGADSDSSGLEASDIKPTAILFEARPKPNSSTLFTSSHHGPHREMHEISGEDSEDGRPFRQEITAQNPMITPTILQSDPVHQRKGISDDGTTLADNSSVVYDDDSASFSSEMSYKKYDHKRLSTGAQLDDQASFTPSSFEAQPRIEGDPY